MAFDLTVMRNQVRGMRDMLPVTASIGGTEYTGWRESLSDERRMELYGAGANIEHTVGFVVADLASVSDIGDTMTLDGTAYRVMGRRYDAARVTVRFDLGEQYA